MSSSRTVGQVALLWRYPVKSMAGEPLETAELSWHGLAGDRRWAFIRGGLEKLITTQTISALGARVGAELDVRRFRPNLVVTASGEARFPEDEWVGAVLRIGGAELRVDKRDQRCVMVNIDPTTTTRDPAILRAIAADRGSCLGVYGTTVRPGTIAVGDPVVLVAPAA